jgi:hypothetical protein
MKKNTILIVVAFVFLVYSCKKESNPTEPSLPAGASLTEAKAYWQSLNITNYMLDQTTDSWYPWSGDSVRITVKADTINKVFSLHGDSALASYLWLQYKTVDQLFEIAELDTGGNEINWEFDTKYGYPIVLRYEIKPPPRTEGIIKYTTYNLIRE